MLMCYSKYIKKAEIRDPHSGVTQYQDWSYVETHTYDQLQDASSLFFPNLPETLNGDFTLTIQILYSDTEYKALHISNTFSESRGEVWLAFVISH